MSSKFEKSPLRGRHVEKKEAKIPQKEVVIALTGKESSKRINVEEVCTPSTRAIPFVGADEAYEYGNFGVGISLPDCDKKLLWGLATPHNLIQSFRTMKILEQIDEVREHTLAYTWFSAEREVPQGDKKFVVQLAKEVGVEKFINIRQEALEAVPTDKELETMITTLRKNNIMVADRELLEEVKAGRLKPSPIIDSVVEECAQRRAKIEKENQEYEEAERREKEEYEKLPRHKKILIAIKNYLTRPKDDFDS